MTTSKNILFDFFRKLNRIGVHEQLSFREKRETETLNSINSGLIVLLIVLIILNTVSEKYFAAVVEIITILIGCIPVFYFHHKRKYTTARGFLLGYAILSCALISFSAAYNYRKVNAEHIFYGIGLLAVLYFNGWRKNMIFFLTVIFYFSVRVFKFFYWNQKSDNDFLFECINSTVLFYIIFLISNLYKSYVLHYENEITSNNKQLAELNEQKDKLFSIIAHDLRSPLGNVNQILSLAAEGQFSKDELDNILEKLSKNASSTSELLDNLLNWATNQMKDAKIKPENFDLKPLVQNKILLYQQQAKQKEILFENNISESVFVHADKNMIDVVLRNLISNAVKFCSKNDRITISAINENGMVKICVADTGTGMNAEDIAVVFKNISFTKLGTANEKGTGLGLPLCKDFVEKNGGKIYIESEHGKGSKVCFTVPLEP